MPLNEAQAAFAVLYVVYVAAILVFHSTLLFKPFRLLTTFLHELSHALACWITCGRVIAIRVFDNEGGVTHYVGGCRVLIIPAGYVGSAIWGCVFVMLSGGRKLATGAAGVLVAMLLASLCYAPNRTMVYLNLGWAVITSIFIYLEWAVFTPLLNFVVLFYGVSVGIHAVFDTYEDLIRRTVLHSDAYACYEQCPCCLPKCVGFQWALCNIVLQILGVWIAMVQMSDECDDKGWGECMHENFALDFGADQFWEWEERGIDNAREWLHQG